MKKAKKLKKIIELAEELLLQETNVNSNSTELQDDNDPPIGSVGGGDRPD